ncbi:INO80 complex subunit B-like isoform X2 [Dreissena polymorpha]|uniref:INO80 complex subunit B-like isoform X2 n=1 Tax=Dreissena polymorpha TaxID=45954 RepID=UPI002263D80B|nr:INO80 complex subunit B-like isoform X2 [Dreissena polymorpha]
MGKRKQTHNSSSEIQSPGISHKKHKKHKKKHKKRATEDEDESGMTSPKTSLKLKFKLGAESIGTKNIVSVTSEPTETRVNVTDDQPWEEEEEDDNDFDPYEKTKKAGDDTSDEEKEWLSALEKGELDDYGEISKGKKDPSLMTARQRALKHGTQEHELLQLPTGYRQVELTEEQLKRREQRANKRKIMAQEKREKDKKQTIDRLLKKQDNKLKGAAKARAGMKKDHPKVTYLNTVQSITISVPQDIKFPLEAQKAEKPPPKAKCAVKGCKNDKKYSCSKTGVSLCSLQCYKKNLSLNKLTLPTVVTS